MTTKQRDFDGTTRSRGLAAGAALLTFAIGTATQSKADISPIAILYVDQRAPADGTGNSWQDAFRDLQDALDRARQFPSGDYWFNELIEIRIAQGTYKPDRGTGDRDRAFDITGGYGSAPTISLRGSFAGLGAPEPDKQNFVTTSTILSGDLKGDDGPEWTNRDDNSRTILRAQGSGSGFFAAQGLHFIGASDTGPGSDSSDSWWGGAVRLGIYDTFGSFSSVGFRNCRFTQNQTRKVSGAAVRITSPSFSFEDCDFEDNRCLEGGGGAVYWNDYGPITGAYGAFQSSRFIGNSARFGGAAMLNGPAYFFGNVFANNNARLLGGALFVDGWGQNECSLFVGNTAGHSGGGIFVSGSSLFSVSGTTFARNTAPRASVVDAPFAPVGFFCTIAWDCPTDPGEPTIDLGYGISESWIRGLLLEGGESSIAFEPGTIVFAEPILNADPKFIRPISPEETPKDWTKSNYRLRPDSPAARAAAQGYGLLQDLDGNNYACPYSPDSRRYDLGCYFADSCICWANLDDDWDGIVNDNDFILFVRAYNTMISPPALPRADLNRDGIVDDADFSLFVVAYDAMLCP